MSSNQPKLVIGSMPSFFAGAVDETKEWLNVFEELGIKDIDTAEVYGASEETLGKAGAASRFNISTKTAGGFNKEVALTGDLAFEGGKKSLEKLQTNSVDIFYVHAPERRVPWKDTFSGINKLYQQGAFKRLGLSNFLAHEVEEVVAMAKENNFVVPSVYQGNYNPIARRADDEILPVLRKHNIAFYAYSPIAGGFLSKSKEQLLDKDGRFGKDDHVAKLYNDLYNRPHFVAVLDVWDSIARDEGVSRAELAYRWVVHHAGLRGDLGDAVILGASRIPQLKQTFEVIKKGPLSDGAVERINGAWDSVKADAVLDNHNF